VDLPGQVLLLNGKLIHLTLYLKPASFGAGFFISFCLERSRSFSLDSTACQAERSRSPTPVRTHSIQNCFYKNIRFNNIAANQDVGFDFAQPDKQWLIDFNIKRNIFLTFI
jgi:hypothetical protein